MKYISIEFLILILKEYLVRYKNIYVLWFRLSTKKVSISCLKPLHLTSYNLYYVNFYIFYKCLLYIDYYTILFYFYMHSSLILFITFASKYICYGTDGIYSPYGCGRQEKI